MLIQFDSIRIFINKYRGFLVLSSFFVIINVSIFWFLISLANANPAVLHASFPVWGGGGDSEEYELLASNIRLNHSFSLYTGANAQPETFRTPGYPFFVAMLEILFNGNIKVVPFFQVIIVICSAFLIYDLALRISNKIVGLIASGLFLFDPSVILFSQTIATESLYTFLLIFSIYSIYRGILESNKKPSIAWLTVAGIIFGFSILVRPSGLLLLCPIVITFALTYIKNSNKKDLLKSQALFIAMIILICLPWAIRNQNKTGVFKLSSVASYNIFNFNIPMFLASSEKIPVETTRADFRQRVGNLSDDQQRDIKNSSALDFVSKEIIKNNFIPYSIFHASGAVHFFFSSGIKMDSMFFEGFHIQPSVKPDWQPHKNFLSLLASGNFREVFSQLRKNIFVTLESLFILLVSVLAISLVFLYKKKVSILMALIILSLAFLTGPVANARYRLPVVGFIYLSAAASVNLITQRLKKYKS